MKNNKHFLKKIAAVTLGFVMTLGVGAAGYSASAGETHAADIEADFSGGKNNLPTNWNGSGLGSDYNSSNSPYIVKLDNTDDYVQYKTATKLTAGDYSFSIKVKMLGGATSSSIKTQFVDSSGNVITNPNVSSSIAGKQNDVKTLTPSLTLTSTTSAYGFRFTFTKGSNVGLGRIDITMPSGPAPTPTQLDSPSNFDYSSSTNKVTWTDVSNASGYGVRIDSSTGTVNDVSSAEYSVSSLSSGSHTLYVFAKGNGSTYSNSEQVSYGFTIEDQPTPPSPSGESDVINYDLTKDELADVSTSGWATNFSETLSSGASITFHSMGTGTGSSIALRWNRNGYLYETKSGGTLDSITIKGASNTINIFASTSAYSSEPTGDTVGTITPSSDGTTYKFTSDYTYFALHGTASSTTINEIIINYKSTTSSTVESVTLSPTTDVELYVGGKGGNASQEFTVGIQGKDLTGDETVSIIGLTDLDGYVSITGKTSGLKNGEKFTITAIKGEQVAQIYSYYSDSVYSDLVNVYVYNEQPLKPLIANPVLSTYSTSMYVGKSQTLSFTLNPTDTDEAISVTSSNSNVISVAKANDTSYTLSAEAIGNATVTVAGSKGVYKTTTSTINVAADTIQTVSVSGSMDKTSYEVGESWDPTGIIVSAYYASAPTTPVTITSGITWNHSPESASSKDIKSVNTTATVSGVTSSNSVTTSVIVTVEHGTTADDPLTVSEAIELAASADSTKFYYVTGAVWYVDSYSSGKLTYYLYDPEDTDTEFEVYQGKSFNGANFSSTSDLQEYDIVVVKGHLQVYRGTAEFASGSELISREQLQLTGISIKTSQTKTEYFAGDTFDPTGLVITASYNLFNDEDISYDDYTNKEDFSFSTVGSDGKVTITFTYYGTKSCEQTVTLLSVTNITGVSSAPSTVAINGEIDPSEVILNATLSNGETTTVVADSVTVNTTKIGVVTATATYSGATGTKTATFQVTVQNEPVSTTIKIADVADENNWSNSLAYSGFTSSDGFVFAASKTNGNSMKYYEKDETWRFYINEGAKIVITAPANTTIVSVSTTQGNDGPNATSWTIGDNGTTATYTTVLRSDIKTFTITYNPPILIDEITLSDGVNTVSSNDENPSIILTKEETTFTSSFEPDSSSETVSWEFVNTANLSFDSSSHKITINDLKQDASGTLKLKSKNITLSVPITYHAPDKTISYISVPSGQTIKNGYVIGDTFVPAGLTINVTYTSSIYEDEIIKYNDCPANFSFTYKYKGASATDPEIPSSIGFSSAGDVYVKIYYEDENGSDDVNTLLIHVSEATVPVSNLSISNIDSNLDFFDHKTGKLTATVTPAGATDKTVVWEALTPELATIDQNGVVTVVSDESGNDQTAYFKCTTNGLDENGQPIVKEKAVTIHRHVVSGITVKDQDGQPISDFTNFELGKTYILTATDTYNPGEVEDETIWDVSQGYGSVLINGSAVTKDSKIKGASIELYCKNTVGTLNVGATILDSARKPLKASIVNQSVSSVNISADKTTLYDNETAEITLSVNQYSVISDNIDYIISDQSVAEVTQGTANNKFILTAKKAGIVTVQITVDGVPSNELTFNVVETLNDISYEGIGDTHTAILTITSAPSESGCSLTDDLGNTYLFTTDGTIGKETSYIHVGTKDSLSSYIKLETDAFADYEIQSISLWGTAKANTNAYAQVSIGGNVVATGGKYTIQNADSGGTELVANNTNGYSGTVLLEIKRDAASTGAIYFNKAVITYTDPSESGTQHIANTDINVQAKVLQFANYFNSLESVTASNWDDIKDDYDSLMNSFETDEEKALAQKMFKYASNSGSSLDTLQKCVKKYDSAFAKLGLTDDQNFMDREKIDISCSIDVSIGFQFTGLDVTKFEFIFSGEYAAENPSSYGFMISKSIDTLNACVKDDKTSGSGVTTFVCDDDEAKCVAGVSVQTGSKLTYNVVFYYVENGEIHYSEVITICINDYLLSDEFDIDSITDPYAKAAIQYYLNSLKVAE